jgi:hypothetical protein
MDAPDPRLAWTFVELGLRDWFTAIHRLMNAQPRLDSIEYVENFLEKLNIRNKYEFAWAIRNLLNNPSAVKVVRRDDKSRYAMDIISIELQYARDCTNWQWPEAVSANNHLPTLLVILWRYYNDCAKTQIIRLRKLREQEEQRRRQQQAYAWATEQIQQKYTVISYNRLTGNNYVESPP